MSWHRYVLLNTAAMIAAEKDRFSLRLLPLYGSDFTRLQLAVLSRL